MIVRSFFHMEDIETRKNDDGKLSVKGYAARFEKPAKIWRRFSEKIRAGAFKKSIEKNDVRALWNHNPDLPLGRKSNNTLTLEEDDKGLRFELDLPDTTWGRDAYASIQRRDVDGMSFGFNVNKQEWDESDRDNVVRTLIEVDLIEVSPCTFPAYKEANVKTRSIEESYEEYRSELQKHSSEIEQQNLNLKKQYLTTL
jgi:uncharacterized protein